MGEEGNLLRYRASCHCKKIAVEFNFPVNADIEECNCSICYYKGFLHMLIPKTQFSLLSGGIGNKEGSNEEVNGTSSSEERTIKKEEEGGGGAGDEGKKEEKKISLVEKEKVLMNSYQFGTMTANHLSCKVCGVSVYYYPRSHPHGVSVNARCVNGGIPTPAHKITPFDGRNYEANLAALQAKEREGK